jgi:hypothetical protein
MKRWLWMAGLAIALPLAVACGSDSNSTPVSPETVGLEAVTAGVADRTQLCHHNPDVDDGDPEWVVILVATSSVESHIENHGDFINDCTNALLVGDDCSSCQEI